MLEKIESHKSSHGIAVINCVLYSLIRQGESTQLFLKLGAAVLKTRRANSRKVARNGDSCKAFIAWVTKQMREQKWFLDSCYGYAKLHRLFPKDEMVYTRTLYNMAWAGPLPIRITELPEALKRKPKKIGDEQNKTHYGTSISDRPEIAALRIGERHTVVGKQAG